MFGTLLVTGRVEFIRKLSPILDGKEHTFLICLFSASRQLQKKTVNDISILLQVRYPI